MIQLPWDAEAVEAMRPSVDASPWAGIDGLADALGQAHLWEMRAGRRRALVAVRGLQCEHGRVLDVVGLRSLGDRLDARELCATIEQLARQSYPAIDLLSMVTRHPHVLRGAQRNGWAPVATVATKYLRVQ